MNRWRRCCGRRTRPNGSGCSSNPAPCPLVNWRSFEPARRIRSRCFRPRYRSPRAVDLASYDLRPAAVRQTGARIIRLLTTIVAPRHARAPVHRALQAAWAPKRDAVADVIRTALVLCADHELNVSAFAARCAASAGASPYDVVSAAMATLKGYKHGGASERVLALFAEAETPERARALVASRLRRGEAVPGFGHPLYPAGDPRAVLLLRLAEASGNEAAWRAVSKSREGRIGVAARRSEPGFRVGGGHADIPVARAGSAAPVCPGPDDRLDCARDRGICVRPADPPACSLHGTSSLATQGLTHARSGCRLRTTTL